MRSALIAALLAAGPAWADQFGGFARYADRPSLEPFARDLGGVLGGATYHSGRSLGFSGFDAGGRYSVQFHPTRGDMILRRKGVRAFGIPWAQGEVGMPFGLDGFVRGISFEGLTIVGGGLRFGILRGSDKPWAPQLLVSGVGHAVVHQHFSVTHAGASAVFSMGIPVFTPFIGGGFDRTTLVVRTSALDPGLNGLEVTTLEPRGSAGFQFRPWPFVYLSLAYANLHGQSGGEGGVGVRF